MNETGGEGENSLSRNFSWTLPLVNLPGRAGMDLNLTLTYNSLVWTRSGDFISFDDDRGFPGPGFRVGFPVIELPYFNNEVGKNAFLLISPNGRRTELRQVGSSALFEAADSSYLLLDSTTMTLRTTDGTQLSYTQMGSQFNCTQIKDRNGNYITITYNDFGIDTVIDTLGRNVKFSYLEGRLKGIYQTWNNGTHTWASFDYDDTSKINTNFTALTVVGTANGSKIGGLSKVTLADGSHYDFAYTTWGQVWKVSSFAPDGHPLNYRSYNLPQTADTSQTDCPRFTERRDWAQYWNGDTDGTVPTPTSGIIEEAITTFAEPVQDSWATPDGAVYSGMRAQVTAPDGTSQKLYFISSAKLFPKCPKGSICTSTLVPLVWQRGLPSLVNTYDSSGALQRQVMTTWTQDDRALSYPDNPHVIETNVYDPSGNRRRTTIGYQTFTLPDGASCKLPNDVAEYAADALTVLRRTQTTFETSSTYLDRRIIGLPLLQTVSDGAGNLVAKQDFQYDMGEGLLVDQGAAVQHDGKNYDLGFLKGRGNLVTIRQFDVTAPDNTLLTHDTRIGYNTHGSVVFKSDADGHTVNINYADSFSDGNTTRSKTFAYPTTVTDPDSNSTTAIHNFDFGAVTERQTPQPNLATYSPGPKQTFAYDPIGRLERTSLANGAYTRLEYPPSGNRVDTYKTIQDRLGEAHSFQITDGLGRVVATVSDHPGSVGGFSGQKLVYDIMGRIIKTSNPTETSASGAPSQWTTAGDDAAAGWIYTQQSYDWKGRPLVTTSPSVTGNPSDTTTKQLSYAGCGCAGSEVVTLTDELGRRLRTYSDTLGRSIKVETLNWDGSVYSATVSSYNARDQVVTVRAYAGAEGSGIYQDTTMTYDGYGRLKTRHLPEQQVDTNPDGDGFTNNSASADHTTWDYNADDTVRTVTDARGAVSTMSYNARHLITKVAYSLLPGVPTTGYSAVTPTASVSYVYDAVGNRTSMSDGTGSTDYQYSSLSQLKTETRHFVGPFSNTAFSLTYQYNLGGQLKKLTDPSNATINYNYNNAGQLIGVTGENNLVAGTSQYASSLQYRAWGALRDIDFGNSAHMHTDYNPRLLPTAALLGNLSAPSMNWTYSYYADGRLRQTLEESDNHFDRAQDYDHLGRLKEAYSGREARGEAPSSPPDSPYRQSFQYDTWDNQISKRGRFWSRNLSDSTTYVNNRRPDITYDAEANPLLSGFNIQSYDASGKQIHLQNIQNTVGGTPNHPIRQPAVEIAQTYDGLGQPAKRLETRRSEQLIGDGPNSNITETLTTTYYLYSSVLGEKVVELDESGQKRVGYVYANGERLANQEVSPSNTRVIWQHSNPGSTSWVETDSFGNARREEMDPQGAEMGTGDPFILLENPTYEYIKKEEPLYIDGGDPFDYVSGYTLDGLPMSRSQLNRILGKLGGSRTLLFDVMQGTPVLDTTNQFWVWPIGTLSVELANYDHPQGMRNQSPRKPVGSDNLREIEPTMSADDCRAGALRTLAAELESRQELFSDSQLFELAKILIMARSGGAVGATAGTAIWPGPGTVSGAVVGALAGAGASVFLSDMAESRIEEGPVGRFRNTAKGCDKIAWFEARQPNAMQAAPKQMFVITRNFGTFALYPYTIMTGPTLLGEYVYTTYGRDPLDPVRTRLGRSGFPPKP